MSAKSLLFASDLPFGTPPGCQPCRNEASLVIRKFGRLYTYKLRDKLTVEDPYLVMVKAEAFAIQNGEPYAGTTAPRSVRDALVKSNVQI